MDFGILQPVDVAGNVQRGFENGLKTRAYIEDRQKQTRATNALRALAANPDDPAALTAYQQADPVNAIAYKDKRANEAHAMLEQHRDSITLGARIIRQVNPKDQAGWDQARQLAAQAGVDMTGIPAQFNPQYIDGVMKVADALAPEKAPQLVPYVPGGGVAAYQNGNLTTLVAPNQGGHDAGSPVGGDTPMVADQSSYDAIPPGQHYRTPDGHVRVKQGGQSPSATGNFPR